MNETSARGRLRAGLEVRLLFRRLTGYIIREILPPFLLGIVLYAAVILFGYFYVSSRYLTKVPIALVAEWLLYQVPGTLIKVFPMAVVLMVVVSFGRLAVQQETVAIQSGGISLLRAARPVLWLAALISVVALLLTQYVVPYSNVETRSLYWDQLTTNHAGLYRLADSVVSLGHGLDLYFQKYDFKTNQMENVRIQQFQGPVETLVLARRGSYQGNTLTLLGYQIYQMDDSKIVALQNLPASASASEIREALRKVFLGASLAPSSSAPLNIQVQMSRAQALATYADPIAANTSSIGHSFRRMYDARLSRLQRLQARVDFNSQLALPLANLVLVLVSLPFALRYGRSTGLSLGISVILAVGYYLLYFLGQSLAGLGVVPAAVGVWAADAVFAAVGLRMLRS
jgi:lipopolysaccharide export system permease protein